MEKFASNFFRHIQFQLNVQSERISCNFFRNFSYFMFWYSLRANVLPEDAVPDTLLGSNYVVRFVMIECVFECVKIICMRINKVLIFIFIALSIAQR